MIARGFIASASEVAIATSGEWIGSADVRFRGIATDSRDELEGRLFVALVGQHFDGHAFVGDALRMGARGVLVNRAERARVLREFPLGDHAVIVVDDTLCAVGDLARSRRRGLALPVFAVTGSNGKTTTKEMLAAILAVSHGVLRTEGNLNNLLGLPMTLLGMEPAHELAVLEMGMNRPGEIARLCEIAEPCVGVVTNIGPAHIGILGSIEAVGNAKGELFRALDASDGVAVVNLDDKEVCRVAAASRRTRTFGRDLRADVRIVEIESSGDMEQRLAMDIDGERASVVIPFAGAHNAWNAAAAIAAATASFPMRVSLDDIIAGLPRARRNAHRMSFERIGSFAVVDDCYNANADSMRAAIATVRDRVARSGGRFVAVLGEMRELGSHSEAEHASVGRALVDAGAGLVLAFGAAARPIADVAMSGRVAAHHEADDFDVAWTWLESRLEPGDVILVKGSRGIAMERFVERIRGGGAR